MEGWERGNWKGKVVITSARLQTRERQTASKEKMGRKRQEGRGRREEGMHSSTKGTVANQGGRRWSGFIEKKEKGGGNERRGRQ